ncbi:YbfB/YjiJ family MFS transporter [Roseibium sediminicola]|uniref:YbfB/YjiJ family MFS transporter n=1 Tax=Roseibium sediminicola TaxID=2933272 RepID=A0ABT0GUK6_9HYPH|nr:YbfB/YjiJ family MFS transporter [Roseibium sp. CAU 1639]MCK7612777.1 YbfB/YjiJ family MFS transporter [Roseibium sp. CAU 1639]
MAPSPRSPVALAFGGLFALAAAMGIGRFVYTPILPFMGDALRLPADDAGLIASANFVGYLAGALMGASRSLPGSPRFWFLGGLMTSALTSAAMAMTTALAAFLAIRFLSGIASAFVLVFSTTLILERLAASGRAGLSAFHFAGVGCGIAFSALLVAIVAGISADWRFLWLASAAGTLVFLALAALLVPSEAPAAATQAKNAGAAVPVSPFSSGSRIRLILAYGLFGFGYVITATFVNAIARTTPELQPTEPFVWLTVGLCAAPSIYLWNWIAARLGARKAFALACVLESAGVALTAITLSPGLFLLGAGLLGGTFMGITALGLMEARRETCADGSSAIRQMLAVLTASFGLGQVIGPWFAGQLHHATGSFSAASLAAAASLLVAAALAFR